jgi:omega-6 fatty acid desaturase (delta-12 desaturase)
MVLTRRQASAQGGFHEPLSPSGKAVAQNGEAVAERYPVTTPPFTLGDVRKAIPAHCFQRSTLKSSLYLLADVVACGLLW